MMRVVSVATFLTLSLISLLHAYWAAGGLWPGVDRRTLIDTVIGDPRMQALPPMPMMLAVIGLIFAAGVFALSAGWRTTGFVRLFSKGGIAVIALVFTARGVSGYAAPADLRARMSEPFASYDQLLYSPLCLAIGAAFVILFFARPFGPKSAAHKE